MANIPLKSIKFPDLADTYTVPSDAGELPYNKSATYPADTVGKALQNIGGSSAPAIIETATGSIASFDDGADNVPVKDLVAEIVPIQSGSGDPSPSNVRAISGWTECNVVVSPTEDAQDGTTYTIDWTDEAGTVYGGRLDVTSGVLTVDRARLDLGAQTWQKENLADSKFRFVAATTAEWGRASAINVVPDNVCADSFKTISGVASYGGHYGIAISHNSNNVFASESAYASMTTDQFKTAMNGKYAVLPLSTPTTYQLTPTEVKSLLKNNNIWADTGDITVEYVADTKTFIENLVNA